MSYRTTRHLLLVLPLLLVPILLSAQTDYGARKATSMLSVGLWTEFGASMTFDPPEGSKVKPIFAYRISANGSYPLTPVISATLGLGYDARGTELHVHNNADAYTDYRLGYFHFTPGFSFSAFWIGVNFGIPLGGSRQGPSSSVDFNAVDEDRMSVLVEPRLGAIIPLVDEEIGWLGLTIMGGVTPNPFYEPIEFAGFASDKRGDFHMVSGHLGLSWQFGIKGTGRK